MRVMDVVEADRATRDRLVLEHVNLVKSMASRLARRLPPQVESSELISIGVLGLIDAATRFRPSLGVPFDAFARRRIQGAMLDALRRLDWAPRSVRKLQRDIDATLSRLRQELKREPEGPEIAAALGVPIEEYDHMLDQLRTADLAEIRPVDRGGDEPSLLDVATSAADGPHVQLERRELRRRLAQSLARLPERERHVLALSYEEELTLAEIGDVIGVSESRVSQIRTQAIARLRSLMTEWLGAPAAD